MSFKEDLQVFVEILKTGDANEAKKEYRKLLKKYHPDHAAENEKDLHTEYILLINKVYAAGKIKTKETEIDEKAGQSSSDKTYIFTRNGLDGKTYKYKCRNYHDYLYKIARNEYYTGHEILHFHSLNYLDRDAIEQNTLEVMQHYRNAIKCFKYLLENSNDKVILSTCEFEIKMVQDAVNNLSRSIISDEKSLMECN